MSARTALPTDVRREVLDAALDIIAAEGPDAVSMREVARRAGVSHQAPYHYFGDRAGIFAAITEEGFIKFADVLRDALASPDPLLMSLRTYVNFAFSYLGHFKVMFRSDICGIAQNADAATAANEAFNVVTEIARAISKRELDEDEALLLPTLMWSQAHGLTTLLIDGPLRHRLPGHLDSVEQVLSYIEPIFLRSINAAIK